MDYKKQDSRGKQLLIQTLTRQLMQKTTATSLLSNKYIFASLELFPKEYQIVLNVMCIDCMLITDIIYFIYIYTRTDLAQSAVIHWTGCCLAWHWTTHRPAVPGRRAGEAVCYQSLAKGCVPPGEGKETGKLVRLDKVSSPRQKTVKQRNIIVQAP